VAISGVLAATFLFVLALPVAYALLALFWRKTKPTFKSVYTLMAGAMGVATAMQFVWWIFQREMQGLTNQGRFYLLIGAVAAGWFGCKGILQTFNKLFRIELREEDENE